MSTESNNNTQTQTELQSGTESGTQNQTQNQNQVPVETSQTEVTETSRPKYEVVFFAKYHANPRPSMQVITDFFNNYGEVHHVNCPESAEIAFVFMTSLNTGAEHRRTRATIGQMIRDMTPENRFYVTVASSNRKPNYRPKYQTRQYYSDQYQGNRYQGNRYQYQQYQTRSQTRSQTGEGNRNYDGYVSQPRPRRYRYQNQDYEPETAVSNTYDRSYDKPYGRNQSGSKPTRRANYNSKPAKPYYKNYDN